MNQASQFDIRFATPVEAPADVSRETSCFSVVAVPIATDAQGKVMVQARPVGLRWIVVEIDHERNLIRESTGTFSSPKLAAWHWAYDAALFDEPMAFEAWVAPMWATVEGDM